MGNITITRRKTIAALIQTYLVLVILLCYLSIQTATKDQSLLLKAKCTEIKCTEIKCREISISKQA